MNEIMRIHIAKIPYDIELSAKKEIEKYIELLKEYANDEELLRDIEIRITELLSLRGVLANGVITKDDVASIREQLGEPKDFMSDDAVEISLEGSDDKKVKRTLYRNVDSALLGGVLSGIASFFNVNALWFRLIFVVLFLFSAGTITLAYIMLWIIIPPARTATEKLQMTGRPVTINSIKELNSDELRSLSRQERAITVRRVVFVLVGIFCLSLSVMTLIFTIFAALNIGAIDYLKYIQNDMTWMYVVSYVLAVLAGLLLTSLFAICSYALFANKFTKRVLISIILVILVGLTSFGTSIGLVSYSPYSLNSNIQRNIKEISIDIPPSFSSIKSLTINTDVVKVEYIVNDKVSAIFKSLSDIKTPSISINGKAAVISVEGLKEDSMIFSDPVLVVYGPKLDGIIVNSGNIDYSSDSQDIAIKTVGRNSSVNLKKGKYTNLSTNLTDESTINASMVAVEKVNVEIESGSKMYLGTINDLSVIQPEVCPADANTIVDVRKVNSSNIKYNGNIIKPETHKSNCGSVIVSND